MQTTLFHGNLKGKEINLQVMGSSAALTSKLVSVGENHLVLSTKKSCKYYLDADKIVGFWSADDAPVAEEEAK
jgi:hypothetical protein